MGESKLVSARFVGFGNILVWGRLAVAEKESFESGWPSKRQGGFRLREWASQNDMREPKLVSARICRSGQNKKIPKKRNIVAPMLAKHHLAVDGKKKALEAVGHPSGGVAFVDEMGEPKMVSAEFVWLGDFRFFGLRELGGFSWGWLDWWFHKRFGTA